MNHFTFSTFGLVATHGNIDCRIIGYKNKLLNEKLRFQTFGVDNAYKKIVEVIDCIIKESVSIPIVLDLCNDLYLYSKIKYENKDVEALHGILYMLGV